MLEYFDLTDFDCVEIKGPDASTFLQGLTTCDIKKITVTKALPAAFCNQAGRVLASGLIAMTQAECFTVIVTSSTIDLLVKHLNHYKLRAQVAIQHSSTTVVSGIIASDDHNAISAHWPQQCWETRVNPEGTTIKLTSKPGCYAVLRDASQTDSRHKEKAPDDQWIWQAIQSKFAPITAATSALFTPNMLAYDQLDMIDFNKGCYLGQEIVARTHHLGQVKKTLQHITHAVSDLPIGSTCFNAEHKPVGTVIISTRKHSLAIITKSELAKPLYLGHNDKLEAIDIAQ